MHSHEDGATCELTTAKYWVAQTDQKVYVRNERMIKRITDIAALTQFG